MFKWAFAFILTIFKHSKETDQDMFVLLETICIKKYPPCSCLHVQHLKYLSIYLLSLYVAKYPIKLLL